VKGNGVVHIKMYDGIVRTFDAWYVSGLRKNLISIGTLDKQGYNGTIFQEKMDKLQFPKVL